MKILKNKKVLYPIGAVVLATGLWVFKDQITNVVTEDSSVDTVADKSSRSRGSNRSSRRSNITEKEHLQNLLLNTNGDIVGLGKFEQRLLNKEALNPDQPDFQTRLQSAYLRSILRLHGKDGIDMIMKDMGEMLYNDKRVFSKVIDQGVTLFGFDALRPMLEASPNQKFTDQALLYIAKVNVSYKPQEYFDTLKEYAPSVLLDSQVAERIFMKSNKDFPLESKLTCLEKMEGGAARDKGLMMVAANINDLSNEEIDGLLETLGKSFEQGENFRFRQTVFPELAKKRPKDAINLAMKENMISDLYADGTWESIGEKMVGEGDLHETISYLEGIEDKGDIATSVLSGAVSTWAAYSPENAVNYSYRRFQNGDDKGETLLAALDEVTDRDVNRGVEQFNQLDLEDNEFGSVKHEYLVDNFPDIINRDEAAGRALLSKEDQELAPQLILAYTESHYVAKNPELGMELIGKLEDPEQKRHALSTLSRKVSEFDLDRAVKLAAKQRDPDARDFMLTGLMAQAFTADPQMSLDLMDHISKPDRYLRECKDWFRYTSINDAPAAQKWIDLVRSSDDILYKEIVSDYE